MSVAVLKYLNRAIWYNGFYELEQKKTGTLDRIPGSFVCKKEVDLRRRTTKMLVSENDFIKVGRDGHFIVREVLQPSTVTLYGFC